MLRRLLAVPLVLALVAAAPPPPATPAVAAPKPQPAVAPPPGPARPALWKLSDADTTIYLFGTIHALPAAYRWTTPTLDAAIASSDELVLETLLDKEPDKAAALLFGLGMSPGLPPLAERVDPAERTTLHDLVVRSRVPEPMLDGMETWAAAIVLTQVSLQTLGLGNGADDALRTRFADRKVEGLETPAQQLGFLDTLPEVEQRRFLVSVLGDAADANKDYGDMLAAWARGDEAAIARSFDEEAEVSPYIKEVLLTRRNQAWAAWLEARMRQPGHVFMAVGAGHLAGAGSVVALLKAKGMTVERVE